LKKYVDLAHNLGLNAEYRLIVGTDLVDSATELCFEVQKDFPRSTVFTGRLAFNEEKFYHKFLHNNSSYAIQRRLQWHGLTNVILPIRINM